MQMAQFQQMQMQQMSGMAGMMPMVPCMQMVPVMQPMVPVMPMMVPAVGSDATGLPKDQEECEASWLELSDKELGESIAQKVAEARDAEVEAKKNAAAGAYIGHLARFDHDLGFGFVVCPSCQEPWGKQDIYIGQKNVVESGLELDDIVEFKVEDNNGKPRVAMNPKVMKEATKQKRLLGRLKAVAKTVSLNNKRKAMAMNAMMGSFPAAKRLQVVGPPFMSGNGLQPLQPALSGSPGGTPLPANGFVGIISSSPPGTLDGMMVHQTPLTTGLFGSCVAASLPAPTVLRHVGSSLPVPVSAPRAPMCQPLVSCSSPDLSSGERGQASFVPQS